ncbi:hypothetical protein DPMN_065750 [Dreissena polymorpha]|uniref:DUF4874 domain-containing protein n=1 Tax=Dreissena polymorpha TaxID=45954 RepID=A0A9D3YXR4_DREPO|nr:hypothetical protein DPMN_065750 [Dreissena polymorpha]
MGPQNNVVLREYYLDTYLTSDLDTNFTDKVKADLNVIQDQGWTVILRFAYLDSICNNPTCREPSYSRMISHIQKLDQENVFRDYEGIIVAIQAGFVGVWGKMCNLWAYWVRSGVCWPRVFKRWRLLASWVSSGICGRQGPFPDLSKMLKPVLTITVLSRFFP